jgi:two-component system cell cycle response regulator
MGNPTLLLIGPNSNTALSMANRLKLKGYQTTHCPDLGTAKSAFQSQNYDLVILDYNLGDVECQQWLKFVQSKVTDPLMVPNLLVCEYGLSDRFTKLFELGVADFLSTPISELELLARVRNLTTMRHCFQELANQGVRDPLTGLFNARYFNERLTQEFERTIRYKTTLACVLLDIDFFKSINEQFGREMGDRIIKHVGNVVESNRRLSDCVARYNAEEFALLLPEAESEGAHIAMERLRSLIMESQFFDGKNTIRVTCSMGIAVQSNKEFDSPGKLFEAAEVALKKAKDEGRNTVKLFYPMAG